MHLRFNEFMGFWLPAFGSRLWSGFNQPDYQRDRLVVICWEFSKYQMAVIQHPKRAINTKILARNLILSRKLIYLLLIIFVGVK